MNRNHAFFIFFWLLIISSVFFIISKNILADSNDAVVITVKIAVCGDDFKEGWEECDNSDLSGQSCVTLGFGGGTLTCTPACELNTSACTAAFSCGDGSCNGSENCSNCPADCGQCPGGGGGGGGGTPVITQVIFRGKAYPGSKVTLLKDAQLAAAVPASPDANFDISLTGLSAGTYNFGIWAEDIKGNRSITHTFPISITVGVTTIISGIFIPPSISIDKAEVKRGEFLNILGYSVPQAEIAVVINSDEIIKKTTADKGGGWLYKFDTLEVENGEHSTRARASKDKDISLFSQALSFKVGAKTVSAGENKKCPLKGDLNNDCKVNLVDFSIAAYWYKRELGESFKKIEAEKLNNDEKINLIDFSIMAYYWTG